MTELEKMKAERDKVFERLCRLDPTDPKYAETLGDFNLLTKMINDEEAKEFEKEKHNDELALKERKMVLDARSADKATEQKDREGKRGVIKAIIGVIGTIVGVVVACFCEDILGKLVHSNLGKSILNKMPKG